MRPITTVAQELRFISVVEHLDEPTLKSRIVGSEPQRFHGRWRDVDFREVAQIRPIGGNAHDQASGDATDTRFDRGGQVVRRPHDAIDDVDADGEGRAADEDDLEDFGGL